MEYREIRITVSEYGKATVVRQWGGMQYENNNTAVCFDIGAIDSSDTSFRIDFDSPEAGYDPGEVIELDGNIISRRIPYKFTRYGGEMQATAVGTRDDGSIAYSVPVKIYFTEVDRHEETEDAIVLNVSQLEMSVLEAAERADDAEIDSRQSAEEAAMSADAAKEAADRAEEAANSMQEQLAAKQDKFADVNEGGGNKYVQMGNPTHFVGTGGLFIHNLSDPSDLYDAANKQYVDNAVKNAGGGGGASPEQLDSKQDKFAYVSITDNTQYVAMEKPTHFIGNGESGLLIHNLADPSAPMDAVNKRYIDNLVGDIESALDSVIALQNSLIGGDA